jgi:broad specificity phosphatase PhoE
MGEQKRLNFGIGELQHLVLVRHGEGEGDVRRAAARRGVFIDPDKPIENEELTKLGKEQSQAAGIWVAKHILAVYGLAAFDACMVSPAVRTVQTAEAMGVGQHWEEEKLLQERDRGLIKGWPRHRHQAVYPHSYNRLLNEPLDWVPPGGRESILDIASERVPELLGKLSANVLQSAIAVTHRDWLWAAHGPIEGLGKDGLMNVDTEAILPAQIIHYTTINPETGLDDGSSRLWKRSVCAWAGEKQLSAATNNWVEVGL